MKNESTLNKKVIFITTLGTMIEWAEYILYGYMATLFAQYYFPHDNDAVGLIKTYGFFAAGYLMRPIGGLLFGHIGDFYGRRVALTSAMLVMGIATMGIGILPTYHHIGLAAPFLLLCCRLLQGLALSGEYNGAGIYLIEQDNRSPCFTGSLVASSAAFGMVIGGSATYIISLPVMPDWAYRIPFMLGGFSCLIAYWIRQNLEDPEEFLHQKDKLPRVSLLQMIKQYPLGFFRVGMIAAFTAIFVYIANIFYVSFLQKHAHLPFNQATLIAVLSQLLVVFLIPIFGKIADKVNFKRMYQYGLIAACVGTPCMFAMGSTGQMRWIIISMGIYALMNAWTSAPLLKVVHHEFPTTARYRGISLAWGLAVALLGGNAMMVAESLQYLFDNPLAGSFYVSLFAMFTWVTLMMTDKFAYSHFFYKQEWLAKA